MKMALSGIGSPCDGYAIMHDIAERTGDARAIAPSTLYSSIRRLLESGLIRELHERRDIPATESGRPLPRSLGDPE